MKKILVLLLVIAMGTTWVESPCTGPHCNLPWSVNPDPITE